jgi:hypothetical protein
MPNLITIYWRDIPAQVMAKQGRQRVRHKLSHRFQVAIDRAAMRAKKIDTDAYLDDWRRVAVKQQGEMDKLVQERAQKLEAEFDDARLEVIIKNKGLEPKIADVEA